MGVWVLVGVGPTASLLRRQLQFLLSMGRPVPSVSCVGLAHERVAHWLASLGAAVFRGFLPCT